MDSSINYADKSDSFVDVNSLPKTNKLVFCCQASGSRLPFSDTYFDCYVSNMVLQLIDSPTKML